MGTPEITQRRAADENHEVVSVTGGKRAPCSTPCPECPWRRENVGTFPAEAFRLSAATSKDMAERTFACHESGIERPRTCAGFLLSTGAEHNLAVRMQQINGRLDLSTISSGGADLFPNYRAMAEANGVDSDDDALEGCL